MLHAARQENLGGGLPRSLCEDEQDDDPDDVPEQVPEDDVPDDELE